MNQNEIDRIVNRQYDEALGYIQLARMAQESGADTKAMSEAAIRALQRISEDDDLIDAMYEADCRAYRKAGGT